MLLVEQRTNREGGGGVRVDKLRDRLGLGQRGMAAQIAGLGPSLGPGSAGWLRGAGSSGLICCVGLPLDKSVKYVTRLQTGCWQRCEETKGDRSSGRGLVGSVELLGVHFF